MNDKPYDQAFKLLAEQDAESLLVLLGYLRYNRLDLLELIGRRSMITLEHLKKSSFYQYLAEEIQKETRLKDAAMMLRRFAAKRFPALQLGEEVDRIQDSDALQQLCLEVSDLPDAETLQRRIAELAQADLAIAK